MEQKERNLNSTEVLKEYLKQGQRMLSLIRNLTVYSICMKLKI